VIATAHSAFDYDMIVGAGVPIVDTRNALKRYTAPHIRKI
jgi:UDP-N-acetyl-D-glucosamine dehydrogenase